MKKIILLAAGALLSVSVLGYAQSKDGGEKFYSSYKYVKSTEKKIALLKGKYLKKGCMGEASFKIDERGNVSGKFYMPDVARGKARHVGFKGEVIKVAENKKSALIKYKIDSADIPHVVGESVLDGKGMMRVEKLGNSAEVTTVTGDLNYIGHDVEYKYSRS